MSDKITELMTYAAMKGDPKLMGLLAGAMGEIEVSDNPKQLAKALRIVATVGFAISPTMMVINNMADMAKEGQSMLKESCYVDK